MILPCFVSEKQHFIGRMALDSISKLFFSKGDGVLQNKNFSNM